MNALFQVQATIDRSYHLNRTEFYKGIENSIEEHMEKSDNFEEAEEAVWHDRRFALKHFIKTNAGGLQKKLFGDSDDEEKWSYF